MKRTNSMDKDQIYDVGIMDYYYDYHQLSKECSKMLEEMLDSAKKIDSISLKDSIIKNDLSSIEING